jgi:hypothetical protein
VVGGASSDAHRVPQRQHVSSWRAIGAWQARQRRGRCRSRMTQRPSVSGGLGAARSSGFGLRPAG